MSVRGAYLLPCDSTEQDKLDIMHALLRAAREEKLLNAPTKALELPPGPTGERSRVLDLGCGTGIWLNAMAEKWPEAEFLGVDMNMMGPATLLPNVDIRVPWDYESPWALGEESWDIIHLQMALGSVQNWGTLYRRILTHLKPGSGWFESVEIDFQPRCDDGTLQGGRLVEWWERYVRDAFKTVERPIEYNEGTGAALMEAGFKDVQHVSIRIPLNSWPPDKNEHLSGQWWTIAMSPGVQGTGGYGMEAYSLAALTRIYGWPADHVRRLCEEALAQAADPNVHAYNNLHIWWARAPHPEEPH